MNDDERRTATAYHEAAHAVIAGDLGIRVRAATCIADEDAWGRMTLFPSHRWLEEIDCSLAEMPCRARRRLEGEILILWAGVLAEGLYLGIDQATSEGGFGIVAGDDAQAIAAGSDIATIAELTGRVIGDDAERIAYVEWLRLRASNMLQVLHIRVQVEAVARELLAHGTLTGKDVRRIGHEAITEAMRKQRGMHHAE